MSANKSKEELERYRKEFWESRVQGNSEVWMTIKQCIDSSPEDAEAILRAWEVVTYTGSLVLCIDKFKMTYRVPVCVINEPESYWPTEEERMASKERPEEIQFKGIKIRTVGQQDKEYDLSSYMTIAELISKYLDDMGLPLRRALLIYDGRVMNKELPLYCFRLDDNMVIMSMILKED